MTQCIFIGTVEERFVIFFLKKGKKLMAGNRYFELQGTGLHMKLRWELNCGLQYGW